MEQKIIMPLSEEEKAAGAKEKVETKDGENITQTTTYETFDWPTVKGR